MNHQPYQPLSGRQGDYPSNQSYRPMSPRKQEIMRRRKRRRLIKKGILWVAGMTTAGALVYYWMQPKVDHWFPTEQSGGLQFEQFALPTSSEEEAFIQVVYKEEGLTFPAKKVKFALVSSSFKVVEEIKPRVVSENDQYVLFELVAPHQKEETSLMMSYTLEGEEYRITMGDLPKLEGRSGSILSDSVTPRTPSPLQTDWLSDQSSQLTYQSYQFFAESLLLTISGVSSEDTYELVENGEVKYSGTYGDGANEGILLRDLEAGHYFIKIQDQLLKAPSSVDATWHTIKRNGILKEIQLSEESGFLMVTVTDLTEAPEGVYDLLIDPGHGGMDGGAVGNDKIEAEEALRISQYLAQRFEDHGLKVKLTREDMDDPSKAEGHNYDSMPYLENGRVDQAYRYQVNYLISNHLNAFDGSLSGYELYSSIRTTDDWTAAISSELKAIGREAKDSLKSEFRQSEGSYKKTYTCDAPSGCDLIYIIRETGGDVTTPVDLRRFSSTYGDIPSYGAESILIEYAYIDNATEMKLWDESYEAWAEAIVKGTLDYLDIPYQEKE